MIGSTIQNSSEKILKRIEKFIVPDPNSGCWLWIGSTSVGYGKFSGGKTREGKRCPISAHRFVYEHHKGKIPEGLELDHLCRTRCCVNPDHLEPVTRLENVRRGQGGMHLRWRTHCPKGHPYDNENTRLKKSGKYISRSCKTCVKIAGMKYYERKKAGKI